jgi:PAS domain S-box-containing protein
MLKVKDIAILIEDFESGSGFRVAYTESKLSQLKLPRDFKQILRSSTIGRGYMMVEELATQIEPPETRQLHYLVPCVVRDRMIAVIGVGRTEDGDLLSSEDTEILRGLSGYVAAAIENSLLYRSEQERAEELTRLKDFNENIIESISVGILTVKPDGTITNLNSTLEKLLGLHRDEAVGKNLSEVFDEDTLATIRNVVGERGWGLEESRSVYKFGLRGFDSNDLIVNFTVAPLESKNGTVTGGVITIEDVTARVRLEEQLQQSDKLSSIGLLAAGVAHEVNTPLTGISSYTQMLMSQISDANPQRKLLEKIHAQTLRASGIVNNLLNFSRTAGTDFGEVHLNRILDDTIQLLEHQLRHSNITIVRHYEDQLPASIGNASRLQQVFMNLIINARDAMPSGGRLDIGTYSQDGAINVELTDEGIGIAPENITRIYDPFFTTKDIGKGTGLGLAVSYGIIQEHGGRIFVTSKPGEGTTFRIKLSSVAARMQVASD